MRSGSSFGFLNGWYDLEFRLKFMSKKFIEVFLVITFIFISLSSKRTLLVTPNATYSTQQNCKSAVSKDIVDKMNVSIRCKADVSQWRSTKEVIRWFNNIENKKQLSFLTFDIVDFNPSITDNLLIKALKWAR